MDMKQKLQEIHEEAIQKIQQIDALDKLQEIRVSYLGKKGQLTSLLKGMKDVAKEERPVVGQMVHETQSQIEELLDRTKKRLEEVALNAKLEAEEIDVTLPAKKSKIGHRHPNMIALEEVENIFIGMGYEVVSGPEIEYDEYNFRKLNIPDGHPAKDEQDTFWITDEIVLRTQTSPCQARTMERGPLPIRMIAPGRVYRSDEVDATHSPCFNQVEGMVIDKNVTMADLKGTLNLVMQELFGEGTVTRFRPHHFPFTEPSCEMDVQCHKCGGKGCPTCKGEGWIEVLGAGMIHPKVLEMSGIDSEEYTGWAFGMGLERLAMRRFKISDLRLIFENDVRFLEQF